MKEHEARLTATGIIWLAFTVVTLGALAASDRLSSAMVLMLVFLFTLAATIGTSAIWKGNSSSPVIQIERSEKAKRTSRVDQMLETMSGGELDELRARLMSESDGEAVGLDELLAAKERRY